MTDTTLTDAERDSLTECECGHYLNEHSSDGCLAVDDLAPDDEYLCVCMASPDRIRERAIESIVAARVADRDALVRWKAEALQVLAAWDDVWKALGSPGLGEFKPASALAAVQRLIDRDRFVRPVRRSYRHVGRPGPTHPLRDLTTEEVTRYASFGYVKFEPYPGDDIRLGRYWKQDQLDAIGKGCGTVTTMGAAIAETYAREPGFYGGTYCCGCSTHKPVGPDGEFVWEGTNQRVGT